MALATFDKAVVVVTGGASGIGLATAQACFLQGAHVIIADTNEAGLHQAEQRIRQSNPSSAAQIEVVVTDVTDDVQVQTLMKTALALHNRIDLVVTSAGIGRGGPIDTFTAQDMEAMMHVNFMGTFHCVRAVLPMMRAQQSGHFVFLCSVAGKLCTPLLAGYCATKWAIRGFSSALRAEFYGTGIDITTVYPAWVDTPMLTPATSELPTLQVEVMLTPEQVANEIIQAVLRNQHDLTLAPNPDIAMLLQVMQADQDKAEQLAGAAFQQYQH